MPEIDWKRPKWIIASEMGQKCRGGEGEGGRDKRNYIDFLKISK